MRNRRLLALTAAAVVAAVGCGAGSGSGAGSRPPASPTRTATVSTASQSPSDAKRDGVVQALAAVPFAARVGVRAEVVAPEGVWVVSRPPAAIDAYTKGCRLGPETGKYPTQTICTSDYGEVLLLDPSRSRILRAYPLPAVPPTFLRLTPDAVFCARQGDRHLSMTSLPDSMVCRIDRHTFAARVHVFAPGEQSEIMQPCFVRPKNWQVTRGDLAVGDLRADTHGVWARDGARWTQLDPQTLAIRARGVRL